MDGHIDWVFKELHITDQYILRALLPSYMEFMLNNGIIIG